MHHQARLHAHARAIAGIDALHLARNQAIANVVQARAAEFLGDGRAQESQLAHLGEDGAVEMLVAEIVAHARGQPLLAKLVRVVAHDALVLGKLVADAQGIGPIEFCGGHRKSSVGSGT